MSTERIYIDTQVFVYFLKPRYRPAFASAANLFLKKVESGAYEGVVSYLVLMELIKVIRELMVEFEHNPVKADWQTDTEAAIATIYKIKNVRIVGDTPSSKVFGTALGINRGYAGAVGSNGRHDGLHAPDAMHLAIAKEAGCTKLATFDRDFDETRAELQPILLQRDSF